MKRPPCLPQSLPQSLGGRAEREQRRRRDADADERKSEPTAVDSVSLDNGRSVFASDWRTLMVAEGETRTVSPSFGMGVEDVTGESVGGTTGTTAL